MFIPGTMYYEYNVLAYRWKVEVVPTRGYYSTILMTDDSTATLYSDYST